MRDLWQLIEQSRISNKNISRLEQFIESEDAEVQKLAEVILQIGRICPFRRRRRGYLYYHHRELFDALVALKIYEPWDDFLHKDFAGDDDFLPSDACSDSSLRQELDCAWSEDDEVPF